LKAIPCYESVLYNWNQRLSMVVIIKETSKIYEIICIVDCAKRTLMLLIINTLLDIHCTIVPFMTNWENSRCPLLQVNIGYNLLCLIAG
ncbi:hypothetical protein L9F63_025269, partial [Diploptera punctata]